MSYTVITTRIDPETKREAQKTAKALGMPLSVIIKGFLKQFVKTKSISFSAREEEIPNERTRRALKRAEENYMKGNTSPALKTGEDAVKWLEEQGI